jgi:hypothetical protein
MDYVCGDVRSIHLRDSMPLTFALDFDHTFTACPDLWARFVNDAEANGHRVFIVTARPDDDENREQVRSMLKAFGLTLPQIYTEWCSKLHVMKQREIKVDIWIEDDPFRLVHGH